MKKLITIFMLLLLSCTITPAFAIEYRADFLEPGNPGGWTESLKTFEDSWVLNVGQEIDVDIWLNDIPEKILSAGFWIQFDETTLGIVGDVKAYDGDSDGTQGAATSPCCEGLPGPWDPGSTNQVSEPLGSGTYLVAVLNFSCVTPEDGGIILGRIRFRLTASGAASVTISTIPDFDTVVGCAEPPVVYDLNIDPKTVTISQGTGSSTTTPSSTTTGPGTTTTTTSPSTTTSAQASTTTTTTSNMWQIVYSKMWGGKKEEKLSLLRSFRDEVVARSEVGRHYVTSLYEHSQEIASLLIQYPLLSMEAGAVVEGLLPSIESFMQYNKFIVTKEQKDDIILLLDHIEAKASIKLQGLINNLRSDLQERKLT